MQISSYFELLRRTIKSCVFLSSWQYEEDARTSTEGFFKARLIFTDGSLLEFREYVNTFFRPTKRYTYSYHYKNQDQIIFRYDNTPHFPELSTFPHHKHIGSDIIESDAPHLQNVLSEIENILISR